MLLFPSVVWLWVLGLLVQICQGNELNDVSIPRKRPSVPYKAIQPAKGVFLVAREKMSDPRFRRSVILLLSHGESGTMGLIVNRSTNLPPSKVLPDIEIPFDKAVALFYGGPVNLDTLMFLIRSEEFINQGLHVMGDVYFSGDKGTLKEQLLQKKGSHELRLFLGHSGWAPGQLDSELGRGDWRLFQADAYTVFEKRVDRIWPDLMKPSRSNRNVASNIGASKTPLFKHCCFNLGWGRCWICSKKESVWVEKSPGKQLKNLFGVMLSPWSQGF